MNEHKANNNSNKNNNNDDNNLNIDQYHPIGAGRNIQQSNRKAREENKLIRIAYYMDKGSHTQQPTVEAREDTAYSVVMCHGHGRYTQQPTWEARGEIVLSYTCVQDQRGHRYIESNKEETHTTTSCGGKEGVCLLLHLESEINEGYTATNWGDNVRDCALLRLAAKIDKETAVSSKKRRRDTQQQRYCVLLLLAAEVDKETTALSPKRRRDT